MLHLGPERCRFRFFGLPKNTKNLGDVCALHLSEASVLEERPQVRFLHRQNEADWGSSEQIQRVKSQKALKKIVVLCCMCLVGLHVFKSERVSSEKAKVCCVWSVVVCGCAECAEQGWEDQT